MNDPKGVAECVIDDARDISCNYGVSVHDALIALLIAVLCPLKVEGEVQEL